MDTWGFQPRERKATGRGAVRVHEKWQRGPRAEGKGRGALRWAALLGFSSGKNRIVQKQTRHFHEGVSSCPLCNFRSWQTHPR